MNEDEALAKLEASRQEATTLRFSVSLPAKNATPQEVLERLHEVRAALDRVEELMQTAYRAKEMVSRSASFHAAVHEDAWDSEISKYNRSPVRRGDFEAPKERYSEVNLATFEQKRAARLAAKNLSFTTEVWNSIKTSHRGLDTLRSDVLVVLRTVQFLSSLENG